MSHTKISSLNRCEFFEPQHSGILGQFEAAVWRLTGNNGLRLTATFGVFPASTMCVFASYKGSFLCTFWSLNVYK